MVCDLRMNEWNVIYEWVNGISSSSVWLVVFFIINFACSVDSSVVHAPLKSKLFPHRGEGV